MTLSDILSAYRNSEKVKQVAGNMQTLAEGRFFLRQMVGASQSFVASAITAETPNFHLFILSDREEAAYLLNDLEQIIGKEKVLFFPMSHRRPYEVEEVDNSNIQQRAETLNRISQSKRARAVVTYPEALCEKVVTKRHLAKNTLNLQVGEKISIDFLNDLLFEYEFERTDYVYEPGQFAIRGGIVDIFSFANENPYRVELFGDEVESLRTFGPTSQLSIANHKKITIVPNVQAHLLKESRESFLEFLPKNTAVWIKDLEITQHKLDKEMQVAEKAYEQVSKDLNFLKPHEKFVSGDYLKEVMDKFTIVEFGQRSYFTKPEEVIFNTTPQPAFNKNFELLAANLRDNTKNQIQNLIAADNPKQIERLYAIFEDIHFKQEEKDKIDFTPQNFSVHEGFVDHDLKIALYTDHQIFERYHRFKLRSNHYQRKEALTLKELHGLNPGDYVTHIDHGVGRFAGLEKIEVNGKFQEAVKLFYKDNDILYVSIHSLHRIAKYSGGEGVEPKMNKLGTATWQNLKNKTKGKVKDIAKDLIKLYAKRKAQQGFEFSPDTYLQTELEASFIYEDTPDQEKATVAFKKDMESSSPMDRLVCGDVGFGKTEVAIRAAFKAVCDSKQVAVLVPTTILALQHYKTFSERLKDFPCKVDYVNRFKTTAQQKETLKQLAEGKIDILVGTHRLVSKDVKFKDLGLLIVDEEQKFGVAVKEKLKQLRVNVDTLTLTATPIPRTLQFSMMGARDLSIITTPPPNRYPVITKVHTFNEETIRDAIAYELDRGGQVFFVHNRVQNIEEVAAMVKRLAPNAKIAIAHGKMDGKKLEDTMLGFIEGEFDILIATSIIESGLDIPNANTIIINNAHYFGLSDLHQMRGRVGRTNKKAFCYLFAPPVTHMTEQARRRLKAIEQFSELGSGFNIAMRDLDIRGAGNLLGAEQSGFITDIGFEMYHKILDEAVQELREELAVGLAKGEQKELEGGEEYKMVMAEHLLFVRDCQIDTDMEILLPDYYVNTVSERLALYKELDELKTEEELQKFEEGLKDRFGPLPDQAHELMDTIRLRWLAKDIGFERLLLKNKKMIGYFVANQNSPYYQSEGFGKVLKYVQVNPAKCKLKESKGKLTLRFEFVDSVEAAIEMLGPLVEVQEASAKA